MRRVRFVQTLLHPRFHSKQMRECKRVCMRAHIHVYSTHSITFIQFIYIKRKLCKNKLFFSIFSRTTTTTVIASSAIIITTEMGFFLLFIYIFICSLFDAILKWPLNFTHEKSLELILRCRKCCGCFSFLFFSLVVPLKNRFVEIVLKNKTRFCIWICLLCFLMNELVQFAHFTLKTLLWRLVRCIVWKNGVLYSGSSIDNLFQTDFYFLQIVWTQIESNMSRSFGASDQPSHVIVGSIRSCAIVINRFWFFACTTQTSFKCIWLTDA